MLLEQVEIQVLSEKKLVGYTIQTSLKEDQEHQIIQKLRDNFIQQLRHVVKAVDNQIYLVQLYPEGDWTADLVFTTIVAVEVAEYLAIDDEMTHQTLPQGEYYEFIHEGNEADIDETYIGINRWLTNQGIPLTHEFDVEIWGDLTQLAHKSNRLKIYVPKTAD